ncbi:MAG TPA: hypothetical protein EYG79_02965 [Rhodobacteraceae bacterium]|nr:hypothetical protein [Paracoccaceae bacterium]
MKQIPLALGLFLATLVVGPLTAQSYDDGREPIYLSGAERADLLAEMRGFLETVQGTMDALVSQDMVAIAELNAASGLRATVGTPESLTAKLPEPFRLLGLSTHNLFDGIAREATDLGDPAVITEQIGGLLANCTSCHATYRFEVEN